MFRQRLLKEQEDSDWFVDRVYDLPVVNSAVGQLTALYSGVKQHNRLFRFTLETAEGGVHVAVKSARPVVARFDKPIEALNAIACQQLDRLEQNYPIITKPTEEVIKETRQKCDEAVKPLMTRVTAVKQYGDNAVKPIVNGIGAVKQYGVDKVCDAKSYTYEKISDVGEYGRSTLSSVTEVGSKQAVRVLETSVCREVVARVDRVLEVADVVVDTYLPGEEETDETSGNEEPSVSGVSLEDDMLKRQAVVVGKVMRLGGKVRRRMSARIANQLRSVQLRSKESIERLHFTVDLIEYSWSSLNGAVNKAKYVWSEVNKTEEEVAREMADEDSLARLHSDSTFERRTIATARHLTQKFKSAMVSVGLPVDSLPDTLNRTIQPVRNATEFLTGSLAWPVKSLDYLHENFVGVKTYTFSIMGQYWNLVYQQWFSVLSSNTNDEPIKSTVAPAVDTFDLSPGRVHPDEMTESRTEPPPAEHLAKHSATEDDDEHISSDLSAGEDDQEDENDIE